MCRKNWLVNVQFLSYICTEVRFNHKIKTAKLQIDMNFFISRFYSEFLTRALCLKALFLIISPSNSFLVFYTSN